MMSTFDTYWCFFRRIMVLSNGIKLWLQVKHDSITWHCCLIYIVEQFKQIFHIMESYEIWCHDIMPLLSYKYGTNIRIAFNDRRLLIPVDIFPTEQWYRVMV